MNLANDLHPASAMIEAARFFSRDEADELAEMAAEGGVAVQVADPKSKPMGFDMSLGAMDSALAYVVCVHPGDVEKLRGILEKSLAIDPHDPLCELSSAELRMVATAPLDANLTEQVIAQKLLASRGPETMSGPAATAITASGLDPYAAADARLARWLGGLGLLFLAIHLSTVAGMSVWNYWSLEAIVPPVLPIAAGGALALSRRRLRDGNSRPMFSKGWRIAGWVCLSAAVAAWIWWNVFARRGAMAFP